MGERERGRKRIALRVHMAALQHDALLWLNTDAHPRCVEPWRQKYCRYGHLWWLCSCFCWHPRFPAHRLSGGKGHIISFPLAAEAQTIHDEYKRKRNQASELNMRERAKQKNNATKKRKEKR
eukprot:gene7834-5465_t